MTVALTERSARRELLLDAADRVVQREGPVASMAAIAAEAGITKPILYRHFGDKSGLYAALAERHTEQLLTTLQVALAGRGGTRLRVERTIDAYLRAIESHPQVYRFLVHSTEAAELRGQVQSFVERMSGLLAAGIAAELGLPRNSPRAEVWGRGIVGMVQAAGDGWIRTGQPSRAHVVRELAALVWGAYPEAVHQRRARH